MARESVLGTALLTGLKAGIFFPFFYHTFLGFRHWSWDIFALGIRDMGTFYNTGYIAIALSLVLTGNFQKLLTSQPFMDSLHIVVPNQKHHSI